MLDKVNKAFPDAKAKVWRTMHYPTDQAAEYDYFMVRPLLLSLSSLVQHTFNVNCCTPAGPGKILILFLEHVATVSVSISKP